MSGAYSPAVHMIRFGPGGIPLSCKGRTQRDGIEDVHTLGLNAMEIQFVRVNIFERYVADEEIGLKPREVANDLIVDVIRGRKPASVFAPEVKLEKGDILRTLNSGIGKDCADLREIGEIASDLDVSLSIHAPYYMDILGDEEISVRSLENIKFGGLVAREMNAEVLVTHLGFYHNNSEEQALEKVVGRMKDLRDWYDRMNLKCKIGLETSGKKVVFGSLDEILAVCKRVPGIVPVISFPHIHAREGGALKRKEDFRELFDKVRDSLKCQSFYTHFSGVEHEGGNELRYTPIKKGDMRFEPLAEYLADENPDVTIISDSPLLEHDAMYMKVILERVLLKNEAKVTREVTKAATPIKGPVKPITPPVKGGKGKVPVKGEEPAKGKAPVKAPVKGKLPPKTAKGRQGEEAKKAAGVKGKVPVKGGKEPAKGKAPVKGAVKGKAPPKTAKGKTPVKAKAAVKGKAPPKTAAKGRQGAEAKKASGAKKPAKPAAPSKKPAPKPVKKSAPAKPKPKPKAKIAAKPKAKPKKK